MTRKARCKAESKGRWAEFFAMNALRLKGYKLLARRFRATVGEIDLIMRRGQTTVFVEVKARATYDKAVFALAPYQVRRIVQAAHAWGLQDQQTALSFCRFDIVVVVPYHWPIHIENAFEGE